MLALYSLCRRNIEPNSSPTGLSLFANSKEVQHYWLAVQVAERITASHSVSISYIVNLSYHLFKVLISIKVQENNQA